MPRSNRGCCRSGVGSWDPVARTVMAGSVPFSSNCTWQRGRGRHCGTQAGPLLRGYTSRQRQLCSRGTHPNIWIRVGAPGEVVVPARVVAG